MIYAITVLLAQLYCVRTNIIASDPKYKDANDYFESLSEERQLFESLMALYTEIGCIIICIAFIISSYNA